MKALSDRRPGVDSTPGHSDEAGILRHLAVWERLIIDETFAPENADTEARSVGEVAQERGVAPFDALLDVVVADRLRTGLRPPIPESEGDWALRADVWQDPRAIVGGSDAGAHLDTMCGAIYSTSMLGDGVRARGLLSWSRPCGAHRRPARLYGLRDRGRLVAGGFADVVVFDPATIGHGDVRTGDDLPGGARPLRRCGGYRARAGERNRIVRDGDFTGAVPGTVLRSGRDTDTVHAGSDRAGVRPESTRSGRRRATRALRTGPPRRRNTSVIVHEAWGISATSQHSPSSVRSRQAWCVEIELITNVDQLKPYVSGWEALAGVRVATAIRRSDHLWMGSTHDGSGCGTAHLDCRGAGRMRECASLRQRKDAAQSDPAASSGDGHDVRDRADRGPRPHRRDHRGHRRNFAPPSDVVDMASIFWLPEGSPWLHALGDRLAGPDWVQAASSRYNSYFTDTGGGIDARWRGVMAIFAGRFDVNASRGRAGIPHDHADQRLGDHSQAAAAAGLLPTAQGGTWGQGVRFDDAMNRALEDALDCRPPVGSDCPCSSATIW